MSLKTVIDPISADSAAHNAVLLQNARHVVALASGATAGALRLTSLAGFAVYGAVTFATILLLLIFSGGRLGAYFESPAKALLWDGILTALPGFVLAWSLAYTLVET